MTLEPILQFYLPYHTTPAASRYVNDLAPL